VRGARALAVLLLLSLSVACVERERLEPDPKPLWERMNAERGNARNRSFVHWTLEVGGHTECSGDRFFEQTTEVYARARRSADLEPVRVAGLSIRFEYKNGLMARARAQEDGSEVDQVRLREVLKVGLNPGAECSCVGVMGVMKVMKRTIAQSTLVCPEDA